MRPLLVCVIIVAFAALGAAMPGTSAANDNASARNAAEISVGALPREARETLQTIKRGGPFAFERDGVAFGNYERRLPQRGSGYYHEYTVPTPGAKNRGARRIVSGGGGEYYYSDDHYRTFKRIRE